MVLFRQLALCHEHCCPLAMAEGCEIVIPHVARIARVLHACLSSHFFLRRTQCFYQLILHDFKIGRQALCHDDPCFPVCCRGANAGARELVLY